MEQEAMEKLSGLRWEKPELPLEEVDEACIRLERAIGQRKSILRKRKIYNIRWWSASVAAVILIAVVSLELLWKDEMTSIDYLSLLQVNDSVLVSGMTQLFVDGQLIETFNDDPELLYKKGEEGVLLENKHTGQLSQTPDLVTGNLNKLVVSYGKRAQLTLSDGSKIWANAGTVLLYPSAFEGEKREIYVEGEIYIDVTPNPEKPFIIQTSDMGVKVLGTTFNVSAYRDDAEKSVVLVQGKVEVTSAKGASVQILPNDRYRQSVGRHQVDKVDVADFTSWKDGRLSFNNTELSLILKQLSRYYNVRINYEKTQRVTCSGKLNLDDSIDKILSTIAETAPIEIQKNNTNYLIKLKRN